MSIHTLGPNLYREEKSLPVGVRHIVDSGASYEMPKQIGQYSLTICQETNERKIHFDDSQLSYLWLPEKKDAVCFDLNESYERFKHINWADVINAKLDEFLQWISKNRSTLIGQDTKNLNVDFVTYRGVLTKLMTTPFVRDKWLIGATKFNGTIYLCPFYENRENTPDNNLLSFGGHRFEHYITRSKPNQTECNPFTSDKGEFSVVMKSKLQSFSGKISLMYAAEVDCLDIGKLDPKKMENFVEIKTTRQMHHPNQHRNFCKFKLIKWWAQSYLVGVSKILCGFKNDQHIVDQLVEMDVHQIPRQCSEYWSRRQCFNFLHQFLEYVKQIVVDDNPEKVYLFSNERSNMITCKDLLEVGSYNILPDWYIQSFKIK